MSRDPRRDQLEFLANQKPSMSRDDFLFALVRHWRGWIADQDEYWHDQDRLVDFLIAASGPVFAWAGEMAPTDHEMREYLQTDPRLKHLS